MLKGSIAGFYGSYMFSFIRNFHTPFLSGCVLYIPTNKERVNTSFSTLLPVLGNIIIFYFPIMIGMYSHLISVFICIFLMTTKVKHLFILCQFLGLIFVFGREKQREGSLP